MEDIICLSFLYDPKVDYIILTEGHLLKLILFIEFVLYDLTETNLSKLIY